MIESNIEKSWKTITLIPDFMNNVLALSSNEDIIKDMVKACEVKTDNDKSELLYALFNYTSRAYNNNSISYEEFLLKKEEITNYFGEIINCYNKETDSDYNELHKEIWYLSIQRSLSNEIFYTDEISKITDNELLDECEIKHKNHILGLHIQLLISKDEIDFEKLNILNSKLKTSNLKVKELNMN